MSFARYLLVFVVGMKTIKSGEFFFQNPKFLLIFDDFLNLKQASVTEYSRIIFFVASMQKNYKL